MARLTPAQRHLQRQRDRAALLATARPATGEASSPAAPAPEKAPVAARPRRGDGLARRVLDRKLAAIAAGALPAINDNDPDPDLAREASEAAERAALSAHDQLRLQLQEHRRILKDTRSVERKVALKRDFLPVYTPWILGVLEAETAAPDEIVTYVMIWSLDVGDYALALELVDHQIRHGLPLPEHFRRDLPTYAAETLAEAAIKAFAAPGGGFPSGVLDRVELLVEGHDMPDEVRAKLSKAQGLECAWLADNPPESQAVAGWRSSQLEAAIACYRRALELDAGVGVKRAIEVLERDLKKDPQA